GFSCTRAWGAPAIILFGASVGASDDAPYRGGGWALDTSPSAPNVALTRVTLPDVRLPEQAIEIRLAIDGIGVAGQSTEVLVEDSGIPVASAKHTWTDAAERWAPSLQYLPPGAAGGRLRVRAIPLERETTR